MTNNASLSCAKSLPCAFFLSTRQTSTFAVGFAFAVSFLPRHTANITFAVCLTIALCCICWHTAKDRFAVCPCFGTRQTFRHTSIRGFPVVDAGRGSQCSPTNGHQEADEVVVRSRREVDEVVVQGASSRVKTLPKT